MTTGRHFSKCRPCFAGAGVKQIRAQFVVGQIGLAVQQSTDGRGHLRELRKTGIDLRHRAIYIRQRKAVADDVMGGVLQAIHTLPIAHRMRPLKLGVDGRKLLHKGVKLRFRRQIVALGIETRVQLQPNATERIGRRRVVVERDHPEPAPFEDMVQRPL